MTEADLNHLLARARGRLRFNAALHRLLLVLTLGALVVAAGLGWRRVAQGQGGGEAAGVALLCGLAVGAGIFAFMRAATSLDTAAWVLDQRANLSEHLTTWLAFQRAGLVAADFRAAQQKATLAVAERVQLSRDLPVRFPAWSRLVWIAVLLLLSAMLMPVQPRDAEHASAASRAGAAVPGGGAGGGGATVTPPNTLAGVQVLSPAEMRRMQMIATDTELPPSLKAQALKELLNKIGTLPESELAPELRELLTELRGENDAAENAKKQAGSAQRVAEHAPVRSASAKEMQGPQTFAEAEKAWAQFSHDFGDVREPLDRYYKNAR